MFSFWLSVFSMRPYSRLRKNLRAVYVIHPTRWLRTVIALSRPFFRYVRALGSPRLITFLCLAINSITRFIIFTPLPNWNDSFPRIPSRFQLSLNSKFSFDALRIQFNLGSLSCHRDECKTSLSLDMTYPDFIRILHKEIKMKGSLSLSLSPSSSETFAFGVVLISTSP